jgi:acetylornithine deacetylase/succinyl-diaminopimelate desuccinylase-like protein
VKVSCRLVPKQDPIKLMKLITGFVKQRSPDVRIEVENQMWPYKAPTTGPLADAVKDAVKFSFGRVPVFVREGGSIGAVISMEQVLESPVMFLGLSLPEHGYHAPNENFDWQMGSGGIAAFVKYFDNVARM